MGQRFYLDEDVDPLLAQVLRDRNGDCIFNDKPFTPLLSKSPTPVQSELV